MTNRTTTKQIYHQYKQLCHITQKQFYLYCPNNRYQLFCNTERGNRELTRMLSITEMYETLVGINRTLETLQGLYDYNIGKITPLTLRESEQLRENLHNEKYIHIVERE